MWVLMVNLLPSIKDGQVTWTTMRVEAQQYIVEGMVDGLYKCVNTLDENDWFPSSTTSCLYVQICACKYCRAEWDCDGPCPNPLCPSNDPDATFCSCCQQQKSDDDICINSACSCSPYYNGTSDPGGGGDPGCSTCGNSGNPGSTTGGTTGPEPTSTVSTVTNVDCGQVAVNNAAQAATLQDTLLQYQYNHFIYEPTGNIETLSLLDDYAMLLGVEYGAYASYYEGSYFVSNLVQGSATNVTLPILRTGVAVFHSHPEGDPNNPNLTGPSSTDFLDLLVRADASSFGLKDSYIYAYDGSKYVMHIEDTTLSRTFMTTNSYLLSAEGLDANAGSFEEGSTIYDKYNDLYYSAINANLSVFEAHDYAMVLIMQAAGVSLLKQESGSAAFKQMGVTETVTSSGSTHYQPYKCQ